MKENIVQKLTSKDDSQVKMDMFVKKTVQYARCINTTHSAADINDCCFHCLPHCSLCEDVMGVGED